MKPSPASLRLAEKFISWFDSNIDPLLSETAKGMGIAQLALLLDSGPDGKAGLVSALEKALVTLKRCSPNVPPHFGNMKAVAWLIDESLASIPKVIESHKATPLEPVKAPA